MKVQVRGYAKTCENSETVENSQTVETNESCETNEHMWNKMKPMKRIVKTHEQVLQGDPTRL